MGCMTSSSPRLTRWMVSAAGVVAVAGALYFGALRPHLWPPNFGVVEAGKLYRAAALTPGATRALQREHGIKTIIDLGGFDKKPVENRNARRTAEALGIKRYEFWLEGDGRGNPNAYVAALRVLADPAAYPVLVHCSAGAQRTSGCVMLYREVYQGKGLDETYAESFGFHHDPEDNPELLPFLKQHEAAIVAAAKAGGWIAGYPELELKPAMDAEPPAAVKPNGH